MFHAVECELDLCMSLYNQASQSYNCFYLKKVANKCVNKMPIVTSEYEFPFNLFSMSKQLIFIIL